MLLHVQGRYRSCLPMTRHLVGTAIASASQKKKCHTSSHHLSLLQAAAEEARAEAEKAAAQHRQQMAQRQQERKKQTQLMRKVTKSGQPVMKYRIDMLLDKIAAG